jgi:hypothetical protein
MKINLWYSQSQGQWRWSLCGDTDIWGKSTGTMRQESGQRPFLRDAMEDVANTVEYMLDTEEDC